MSANSWIVSRSSRRWIDNSVSGTASVMKPGLLPVLWIDVLPSVQAASTRARMPASMLGGWWNIPHVDTTLMPAARSWQITSTSPVRGMYSTQSGLEARIVSSWSVAATPTGASPAISPPSRPTLSAA